MDRTPKQQPKQANNNRRNAKPKMQPDGSNASGYGQVADHHEYFASLPPQQQQQYIIQMQRLHGNSFANQFSVPIQRIPAVKPEEKEAEKEQEQEEEQQAVEEAPQQAEAEAPPDENNSGDGDASPPSDPAPPEPPEQPEMSGDGAEGSGEASDAEQAEKEQSDSEQAASAKDEKTNSEQEAPAESAPASSEAEMAPASGGSASSVELVSPEPQSGEEKVQGGIAAATAQMGKKKEVETDLPPASENVQGARQMAEQPTEELEGRGQLEQVAELGATPGPSPEIIELGERIRKAIKEQRPVDEDDLGKAKPQEMADKAGHMVDSNIRGEAEGVQDGYDDLEQAETAQPTQEAQAQEPIPDAQGAPPIDAEQAVPEPHKESDLDLSDDVEASKAKMEEAGMMSEPAQLVQDGPIADARESQEEFEEFADKEPGNVVQEQQMTVEASKASLSDLQASATASLAAAREQTTQGTQTQQVDMKGSEEDMRAQVGQQAQTIYDNAQKRVDEILAPLPDVAMKEWDNGVKALSNNFEASLSKVDKWIEERHSGVGGAIVGAWDSLTGLPDWITSEYDRAEKAFGDGVVQLLKDISTYVNTKVAECQTIIKSARDEIKSLYDSLPEHLQGWAQEQQAVFNDRLNGLSAKANNVRDNFNEQISQQATQAVAEVQARVAEMREKAKGLLGKLADAVGAFLENPAKFIIDGLLKLIGIAANAFWNVVDRIGSVIDSIAEDPISFVNNLMGALAQGFTKFFDNIKTHLLDGMFSWLFSRLAEAGVNAPKDLSLESIITFFLEVMGFTWDKIKAMIAKHIGEDNMEMIEQAYGMISDLMQMGPAGLFALIKEQLDPQGILDMILKTAMDFVVETLIKQVAVRLLGMLNPAGAILQAIEGIYKVLSWLFENASQIFSLIETVVGGITDIIKGNVGGMANAIHMALKGLLPVVIDFLADYLGLGDLPKKVGKAVKGIQKRVEDVINKVIGFIASKAKKVMDKLGFGDKDADKDEKDAEAEENAEELSPDLQQKKIDGKKEINEQESQYLNSDVQITEENARKVAAAVSGGPNFKSVEVVYNQKRYDYDYVIQRGKKDGRIEGEDVDEGNDKIPNPDKAVVDDNKLIGYSLSTTHNVGKHKARVFKSALGLTAEDAPLLKQELLKAIVANADSASVGKKDNHGQRYTVYFDMTTEVGTATILSGWIVRSGEDFPRLTTCYIKG